MKKPFAFLLFLFSLSLNAQVTVNTVFTTTEDIAFVSDDGNGIYTVSGDGSGDDGFLAVYDENSNNWEVKNFPPNQNYGNTWNAKTYFAYTYNGITIAYGKVAEDAVDGWEALRKYSQGDTNYSQEIVLKGVYLILFPPINGEYYGIMKIFSFSDTYGWASLPVGRYLVKINPNNLSLEWAYQVESSNSGGTDIVATDPLVPMNKVYRYAVQSLPNGNLAVSMVTPSGPQLWEFTTAGSFVRVIDDANTDYNHSGTASREYQGHRWKVIGGDIYHEFYNSVSNTNDTAGHWEKLSVPGYQTGGTWSSDLLQVVAESDEGNIDSFLQPIQDFWIDSERILRTQDIWLTETLSSYKKEDNHLQNYVNNGIDFWFDTNGTYFVMSHHELYKVQINEMYSQFITVNPSGTDVVDAKDDMIYHNGWETLKGEATIVVNSMPNVGDQPNSTWWNIPNGFHYQAQTPIQVSNRIGDAGRLYFLVEAMSDTGYTDFILRVWVIPASMVSVQTQDIADLSVYPNPVVRNLYVHANAPVDVIHIYNMTGQLVKTTQSQHVFVGDLPRGVYMLEIVAGDKVSRREIVKE